MFIRSSVSNIKLQLGLILSPKNYNLMTGLSLYKWVVSCISVLIYGTQLGRRGFRVSALPFIDGKIVVFLYAIFLISNIVMNGVDPTIKNAVKLWLADKTVLPIENSLVGSIHRNYDLLLRHKLHIVGEVQLAVNLCLLALLGVRTEHLKRVLSHLQRVGMLKLLLRSARSQ
ncbi:hypothetical protein HYC85_029062 [Camellia sinensis]|uniref:Prephenate dehydratase domain-containing protein n=1 Tax=Camellia sinensis TaxID=4442 RepID=A0A7J7FY40_CAMSI|nr:hypothetical protein HYC85_029062 [Camellia sinensis]